MGTSTIEGRNNPDTHWVVSTIMVVKSAHGNSVNKYEYKQQNIRILTLAEVLIWLLLPTFVILNYFNTWLFLPSVYENIL